MWNPFHKKKIAIKDAQPGHGEVSANRVDALANRLQQEGRPRELESELRKLDLNFLSPKEQESWWHLFGICAFQENRETEALERFRHGYEKFPKSAQIRFSLGQQLVRTGSVEEGFAYFLECHFPDVSREFIFAMARYAYLWSRYEDGLAFIRPIFEFYKKLKILDDTFLYMRGLPFFGQWWSTLAAFSILSGNIHEIEEVTSYVTKNCYDYDFENLNAELCAYRDKNPIQLLKNWEKRIEEMHKWKMPTGYVEMRIAITRACDSVTLGAARAVLSKLTLAKEDHSWLEDVRTLALAELAGRFGDHVLEHECTQKFLARQPLLLEPNLALDFHLLLYQEKLKPKIALKNT